MSTSLDEQKPIKIQKTMKCRNTFGIAGDHRKTKLQQWDAWTETKSVEELPVTEHHTKTETPMVYDKVQPLLNGRDGKIYHTRVNWHQ